MGSAELRIDYRLTGDGRENSPWFGRRSLANADETTLRYDCFLGDVWFEAGSESIRADWITLLDVGLCVQSVREVLRTKERSSFDFTESDEIVAFEREGDTVTITSGFSDTTLVTSWHALSSAVDDMTARLSAEIVRRHPAIEANPVFRAFAESSPPPAA